MHDYIIMQRFTLWKLSTSNAAMRHLAKFLRRCLIEWMYNKHIISYAKHSHRASIVRPGSDIKTIILFYDNFCYTFTTMSTVYCRKRCHVFPRRFSLLMKCFRWKWNATCFTSKHESGTNLYFAIAWINWVFAVCNWVWLCKKAMC